MRFFQHNDENKVNNFNLCEKIVTQLADKYMGQLELGGDVGPLEFWFNSLKGNESSLMVDFQLDFYLEIISKYWDKELDILRETKQLDIAKEKIWKNFSENIVKPNI
jgi:hypothetical protein